MPTLTQLDSWQKLVRHFQDIKSYQIDNFFKHEDDRVEQFCFRLEDLFVDLSLNRLSKQTKKLLVSLAAERELKDKIIDFFVGENVNFTENKPALHMALRVPDETSGLVASKSVLKKVIQERQKMYDFANRIRQGHTKSHEGKTFTDLVMVGVGGSMLGPSMLYHAFKKSTQFNLHFVSSLDGEEIDSLLNSLNPKTTLFFIISKSFQTADTLANARTIQDWLQQKLGHSDNHLIGISENTAAMHEFGIQSEFCFTVPSFVGGRYSVWSSVSLPVVIALGSEVFDEFLAGGHAADAHFKDTELNSNIPALLGLLDVWYDNFFNWPTRVILPYTYLLKFFPHYLQQLEMESCGKRVTHTMEAANYQTGPIVWGDVGFSGQHSFYQLLEQGTQIVPSDFIVPIHTTNDLNQHKQLAVANALAHIEALTKGNETVNKFEQDPGNRPTTLILFPQLTPRILGMLVAIYEHKVFTKSVIWNINPFDQYGVELGKRLTKEYLTELNYLSADNDLTRNPMLTHILQYIREHL